MSEFFSVFDIAGSGLTAQQKNMGVIAGNIANANSLQTPEGGPYRRRQVTFETVFDQESRRRGGEVRGVRVSSVREDKTPLKEMYDPGHPLADDKGYVKMPNINVISETMRLTQARRAYGANLSALKVYRDMLRSSLSILRG